MASVIITLRWLEPCPGEDAKVACLTEDEGAILDVAIDWAESQWTNGEWGDTVARVDVHPTNASGGDLLTFRDALGYVATNVRYDTGEGIYAADCPAFRAHGIVRS